MDARTIEFTGRGSILIAAPIEAVFDFISDPGTRWDFITPLESRRPPNSIPGSDRYEFDIAGRILHYEMHIAALDRPRRLVMDVRGDVRGTQVFSLSESNGLTELALELTYEVEPHWPSYFHEEPTASRFPQTLVAQTLEEIRTELEVVLALEPPLR